MPINNTTPNQGYQLPDGTNTLAYDVTRIINAITSIDLSVTARPLFSAVTYVGTTSIALNRTSANQSLTGITSIDGSAATLTTARTLWGQSFDGSAAVSGNLTAVGNITGSGAISLTTAAATNLSLTSGTTGSVTLDSGTTGAINIGTGANTKTITLGSSTGTVQLPTAVTKVGQTSLVQGGIVNVTLPTLAGTLVGSGDTGTVTSTMLLDGTILNADVNASAAIAGTKISPDFGSQNVITTGTGTAATFISGAGTVTANGIQVGTGTTYKPGIYSPGADQLAISTGGTSRILFDGSGRLLVGGVAANANGGILQLSSGITFPATQVAATDANTLDDYEEGTWTPVYVAQTGTLGAITYANVQGVYTKIGRLVTVTGGFYCTAFAAGTGSGDLRISGLPFANIANVNAISLGDSRLFTLNNPTGGQVGVSVSYVILFYRTTANGTINNLQVSDAATGSGALNLVYFTASYQTS